MFWKSIILKVESCGPRVCENQVMSLEDFGSSTNKHPPMETPISHCTLLTFHLMVEASFCQLQSCFEADFEH